MKYSTKKLALEAAKILGGKVVKVNPMQALKDAHYGLRYPSGWKIV